MIASNSTPPFGGSLTGSMAAMAISSKERKPCILYIDAYDSFSNNITALLETSLEVDITTVKIDQDIHDLPMFLKDFDAVVVGPGPGNPENKKDIGFVDKLWKLSETDLLPILGICLGFQSLALAFGATIEQLKQPRHGIVSDIVHDGMSIFKDVDQEMLATQYHSLHVNIGHPVQIKGDYLYFRELWGLSTACPELKPLAWDLDDKDNGPILMALRHIEKPFYGLQYHPESICSSAETVKVIRTWWEESKQWNSDRQRTVPKALSTSNSILKSSLLTEAANLPGGLDDSYLRLTSGVVNYHTAPRGPVRVTDLCEVMEVDRKAKLILLESAAVRPNLGRYTILGIATAGSISIEYTAGDRHVELRNCHGLFPTSVNVDLEGQDIWVWLAHFMKMNETSDGDDSSPFWGGLMGYIPYDLTLQKFEEATSDKVKTSPPTRSSSLSLAFIQRSIVIDHEEDIIYIQSIIPVEDDPWLYTTKQTIQTLSLAYTLDRSSSWRGAVPSTLEPLYWSLLEERPEGTRTTRRDKEITLQFLLDLYLNSSLLQLPCEDSYRKKIKQCQKFIRSGDSYELCLTDQSTVLIPMDEKADISWLLYKKLKRLNPAPFAAYINLEKTTIISSSPERFLSWDRQGSCQFRPIKGTVSKSPDMTKEIATEILATRKEKAENLMIVDLIRHDLHGVVGAGNVSVTELMSVEEYATVYQLVSVIEGQLPASHAWYDVRGLIDYREDENRRLPPKDPSAPVYTGLDVLAASLPPGSMTGAPKRRSCALLQTIEQNKPRGCYSGVLGYLDVGGGGDFSVVIRSAFRNSDEVVYKPVCPNSNPPVDGKNYPHQVWHVGAGGAITALSDEKEEYEEMGAKAESTLAAFKTTRNRYPAVAEILEGKREKLRHGVRTGVLPEAEPLLEWMDHYTDDETFSGSHIG